MSLLKKENWFICFILMIISQGTFIFVLAYLMRLYDKKAWYYNYKYWMLGIMCLFFPALIMLIIFMIQMTCKVAASLDVPGKELYNTPYTWIVCLIVPIVGWVLFIVMLLYIIIWPFIMLKEGK
ncbi:MAG: hypothetical protein PHN42_02150 [Bacilli bacterium]|nr:hypothetical protein [Bacilli bacterium]